MFNKERRSPAFAKATACKLKRYLQSWSQAVSVSAKGAPSWQPGATPQGEGFPEKALKARFKPDRLNEARF
jgi:hypothetical protein